MLVFDDTSSRFRIASGSDKLGSGVTERFVVEPSGDVGIGQTSPDGNASYTTLHIGDNAASPDNARLILEGSTNKFGIYAFGTNLGIYDYTSGANRLTLDSSGNVGIGVAPGTVRLDIQGSTSNSTAHALYTRSSGGGQLFSIRNDGLMSTGLQATSPYNLTTAFSANMHVNSAGNVFRSTSSARYKRNIQDMTYGVADVMNLRAVTFEQKNEYPSNTYAGFIAEEVHDAGLTEFVEYNNAGQPDAVHYGNMVSLLAKAIQEQQATIASLTARIEQLEAN